MHLNTHAHTNTKAFAHPTQTFCVNHNDRKIYRATINQKTCHVLEIKKNKKKNAEALIT